jgi:alkylhydroperoxidase family enzyme
MAWIRVVSDDEAMGDVKEVYEEVKGKIGRLSPMLQSLSLRPDVLRRVHDLGNAIHFGGSSLGKKLEQMLAVVVSAANGCRY